MIKLISNIGVTILLLIMVSFTIAAFSIPTALVIMLLVGNISNATGGDVIPLSFVASYWASLLFTYLAVSLAVFVNSGRGLENSED